MFSVETARNSWKAPTAFEDNHLKDQQVSFYIKVSSSELDRFLWY
jgi:hypothetical protein